MATTINKTDQVLADMLTENTGRSMLDSGDYYGRHWQQNQGKTVDHFASWEGRIEFYSRDGELDICATINVFRFLSDRLEFNEELDNQFRAFYESDEREYTHALDDMRDFVGQLPEANGIYGDSSGPVTVNTYNGEDLLSQVIQYIYWTDEDGPHVLLQIHGGCDVRGGYTMPRAFDVADYDGTSIFDNARAVIACQDCRQNWWTDDGYHWYDDDSDSSESYRELSDYPATDEEPTYPEKRDPAQRLLPVELPERPAPNVGVIWVDEDGNGHCPCCGGVLAVYSYPAG